MCTMCLLDQHRDSFQLVKSDYFLYLCKNILCNTGVRADAGQKSFLVGTVSLIRRVFV